MFKKKQLFWSHQSVMTDNKPKDPEAWRYKNLHPDFEFKECIEHGIGRFSVNKQTGEVCDCKMEWNEDGTILSCPICGLDGT